MNYSFTDQLMRENPSFLLENMMGPNAMRVTEELCASTNIPKGARILDLGCGTGLSSILLAEKYGATVYAADLWVSPSDNYARFQARGLENRVIPLSADVTRGLPFAHEYFDFLFCVDAYHYFGAGEDMLPFLLSFLKQGGILAVGMPGVQRPFPDGIPAEMTAFWQEDMNFHPLEWWRALWEKAPNAKLLTCREMDCHQQAWEEWLKCPSPYAVQDIPMMAAENGQYFSHIQMMAQRVG